MNCRPREQRVEHNESLRRFGDESEGQDEGEEYMKSETGPRRVIDGRAGVQISLKD